jgi:acyl carrier protein
MSSEQTAATAASSGRMIDRLRNAPASRRRELLSDFLQEQLAYALGVEQADINRDDALMSLGMDSLKAVEAKLYLEDELGIELESALLFDHPTIDALTGFLLGSLGFDAQPAAAATDTTVPPVPGVTAAGSGDALDNLSGDDIARLLAAELASIPAVDSGRADD